MAADLLLFACGLYPDSRVTQLVDHLGRMYSCRVICLHPDWAETPGRLELSSPVSVLSKPYWRQYGTLRKVIRKEAIKVVWAYNLPPVLPAILMTRFTDARLVVNFAGGDIQYNKDLAYGYRSRPLGNLAVRTLYSFPDYFVCMSPFTARLATAYGLPARKLVTIPNMFDIEADFPRVSVDEARRLRETLGLGRSRVVLCVAHHRATKRIDQLLRAVGTLNADGLDCRLVLAGTGELLERHKHLAKDLGIDGNTLFVGRVDRRDLGCYYAMSDVSCNVSDQDAFCNPVVESLTQGTPVVVGPRVGAGDYIRHEPFCEVAEPDDHEAIAAAIGRMLAGQVKETYCEQAVAKARQFDTGVILPQWKEFFDGLLT